MCVTLQVAATLISPKRTIPLSAWCSRERGRVVGGAGGPLHASS
ncbi:conserved hypothetical protein, partial [Leishmania braziliensis MHOM/BR/75/M2904]